MVYVLDTHPIVWFVSGSPRLTSAAHAAMSDPTAQLIVPAMALIEIRFLADKCRIPIDVARVQRDLISASNCTVYPIDEQVVSLTSTRLNIHDAIMVATALVYRDIFKVPTALITKDTDIRDSGLIQTIW